MASVEISKWDIARAFGLYWDKFVSADESNGWQSFHQFEFQDKLIQIQTSYYTEFDVAKEEAAEQVLNMIAKAAVTLIK